MSAYATKLFVATNEARAACAAAVEEGASEEVYKLLKGVIDRLELAESIRQESES